MIPVTPRTLILILLFAPLAAIALAGAWYSWRRMVSRRGEGAEASFYRCRACGHVYLDYRDGSPKPCDKCGCVNESIRGLS